MPPERRTEDPPGVVAGRRPVSELLRAGKPAERILVEQGLHMTGLVGEIRRRAEAAGIPVRAVPRPQLDDAAPGINHQGVMALTGRFRYAPLESLLSATAPSLLLLDGVTDPHNLGSLIRSAEVAGFTGVVIPSHRSAGVTATVRRVSAGAAELVPIARVVNLTRAIEQAKGAGLWILGLAAEADESLWDSELADPPVGLVLGSEGKGLSRGVRTHCDALVRIPLGGRVGSLNVGVAGAVAMFEVARRKDRLAAGSSGPVGGGKGAPR